MSKAKTTPDEGGFCFDCPIPERKMLFTTAMPCGSLQNVSITVNGTYYEATELGNNYYRVDMPDLKKPDTYYADVYSGDNLIAGKLPFIVRKDGQREKDLL